MPLDVDDRVVLHATGRVMAKPNGAIKKRKQQDALNRRLVRGAKKLAAKQARAQAKTTQKEQKA